MAKNPTALTVATKISASDLSLIRNALCDKARGDFEAANGVTGPIADTLREQAARAEELADELADVDACTAIEVTG